MTFCWKAWIAAMTAVLDAAELADNIAGKLPFYRRGQGIVLDKLFGSAEDFNYVSTTSPPVTPPPQ